MIGQALKNYARERGLSDAEVARRSGISAERYGNYARDKRQPDFETLLRICQTLNITPNALFGLDPENASLPSPLPLDETLLARILETVTESFKTHDIQPTPKTLAGITAHLYQTLENKDTSARLNDLKTLAETLVSFQKSGLTGA